MAKTILSKAWHYFSNLLIFYGYYLLFLFFYDTFLRVVKPLALPLALIITLSIAGIHLVFILRRKKKND
ncbi:hypothetical protein [Aquifex aeolicus]|uniref:hypothetical protein n=1 Tax=Aquifex aeolicus TaxID=63363 RepID=UPI00030CDA2A|nr:hypothetical protein [Aquifex aeolicus]